MKGMQMDSTWRTVQVFLSSSAAGVFEVEVDIESKDMRCTCPVWRKSNLCKHIRFVKDRMTFNKGHYSIMVPHEVPEELAAEANEDSQKFREFVLRYAKIEVL